ncbi:CAP domain-containing protein [uncultured Croceitalea sp.]|uniref:CAP domain-containing protein n=1 Tax=uncultured Croceitalea sp. TaxID=1798908 RepID=UPI0033061BED
MKMAVIIRSTLVVSILILFSCTTPENEPIATIETTSIPELEAQLLTIVNEHRELIGLSTLQHDPVAYEHASEHNDYMIARGNLSHDNFDSRASKIASETQAKEVGENVARDYDDAKAALNGWLSSPPHKNTLENNYTHTAISVKKDGNNNIYYTQIFFK